MPRPKIYVDVAARMRAYREAKKLGLTVPEYRARKAGTTVTPAPVNESLQTYRERIDKAVARATSQPSDFEPMTLGDLAAGKAPVKRKVTPNLTPAPTTLEIFSCRYLLPLSMNDISRITKVAFVCEQDAERQRKWKAAGCCGAPNKPWNTTMEEMLRDNEHNLSKAKKAILEALGGNVTPTVTPAPELKVGQVFTISKFWIEKDGKEMQVPMRFRIDNLPEGDGDFHTHRGGEYKGRKFATAILEVIEEPKPVTVTKPDRRFKAKLSPVEARALFNKTANLPPAERKQAIKEACEENRNEGAAKALPPIKKVRKIRVIDPRKALLKRFRDAKCLAKFYCGMMDELSAVGRDYAHLLNLWSGEDGYPWTPPTPTCRLPKTEKEFQAEYDKATTDFNRAFDEYPPGQAVTVTKLNPAQFDEHGNYIPPEEKKANA